MRKIEEKACPKITNSMTDLSEIKVELGYPVVTCTQKFETVDHFLSLIPWSALDRDITINKEVGKIERLNHLRDRSVEIFIGFNGVLSERDWSRGHSIQSHGTVYRSRVAHFWEPVSCFQKTIFQPKPK